MDKKFSVQELAIAITAKNLNPTALNPDFLKYSDIVPESWELARPPVYSERLVRLLFKNGVGIVAEPNRLVFVEAIGNKSKEISLSTTPDTPSGVIEIPELACRCVQKLPNMSYQAVGINPKGYSIFSSEQAAHQYVSTTLLADGDWQSFGTAPMKASLQLSYPLEQGQLNLAINEVSLRSSLGGSSPSPESESLPAILFSGNFNFNIQNDIKTERLNALQHYINNWETHLEAYKSLIENQFLQAVPAVDIASA